MSITTRRVATSAAASAAVLALGVGAAAGASAQTEETPLYGSIEAGSVDGSNPIVSSVGTPLAGLSVASFFGACISAEIVGLSHCPT